MKLKDVTPAQRKRIARRARTSDDVVRNIQAGRRRASAEMAIRLERAAVGIGVPLKREDMCEACGGCDLARKGRKG